MANAHSSKFPQSSSVVRRDSAAIRTDDPLEIAASVPAVSHRQSGVSLARCSVSHQPNHLSPQEPDWRAQEMHPAEQSAQRRSQK